MINHQINEWKLKVLKDKAYIIMYYLGDSYQANTVLGSCDLLRIILNVLCAVIERQNIKFLYCQQTFRINDWLYQTLQTQKSLSSVLLIWGEDYRSRRMSKLQKSTWISFWSGMHVVTEEGNVSLSCYFSEEV